MAVLVFCEAVSLRIIIAFKTASATVINFNDYLKVSNFFNLKLEEVA